MNEYEASKKATRIFLQRRISVCTLAFSGPESNGGPQIWLGVRNEEGFKDEVDF